MKLLLLSFCICATVLVGNVSSRPQEEQIPGGSHSVPADNENVKRLALFSLSSIAQQSGSQRPLEFIRVISAKSQVVSGVKYDIKLLACEKNADSVDGNNSAVDEQSCRACDVSIWEQPWLNKTSVLNVSCSEPSALASFSNAAV